AVAGENRFGVHGRFRKQGAFGHRKYLSVLTKPLAFSGRESRQGSSGDAGGPLSTENFTGFGAYAGFGSSGCCPVSRITRTFISARSVTESPADPVPSTNFIDPSSPTTTLLKKFTFGDRSRNPSPCLPNSAR